MKKILLGILCAGLSVSCAGKKSLISITEVSTPIVIDGEITDWMSDQESPIPFYVKDDIRYAFTTDVDYLYIVVEAKQQADVMKMAGMGFTMWFNEDGKKKKSRGIRYPIGSMSDEMGGGMQPGGMGGGFGNGGMGGGMGMDQSMMYDLLSQEMDVLELIGFYSDEEMYIEVAEEDFGIKVKASFTEDGLFINEFAIPKKLILTKEGSDKLAVGFFTDEMERPSFGGGSPGGMGGGMQPPSGGMGGMGGGMRPGGMGGQNGMQEMMEPIKIWTTLDVSEN